MNNDKTRKMIEKRQKDTKEKTASVLTTIRDLKKQKKEITVSSVAKAAGVSRNFLYDHPELLQNIDETKVVLPDISDKKAQALISALKIRNAQLERERDRSQSDLAAANARIEELEKALKSRYDPFTGERVF